MPYPEFCRLLSGISPKTPLGNIVSIRMEDDKEILKGFTRDQHRIRNEWRNKNSPAVMKTKEEREEATKQMQQMFAGMFG